MKLNENFNKKEFIDWITVFLPGFSIDTRNVEVSKSFKGIRSIETIGESELGVRVYIIESEKDPSNRKIGLATESFTLLRDYGTPNAIVAYYSEHSSSWRLSFLTSSLSWDEGKIKKKLSNPKRHSYVLGPKAKVKTPYQYLISKGHVIDFNELKSRFSLEVVNKEFYKEISNTFIQLVGGQIANGKSKKIIKAQLKLPSVADQSQTCQEFAVRLIGRIIFCWFLREKRSSAGHSLMPHELLSLDASNTIEDYYHKILEPIFFEILNKPIKTRKEAFVDDLFSAIPYLNGGLFSPHEDDFFNYNEIKQSINHNIVIVPDKWIKSLFEILETYNFTIDENTSFDEELSIDPEMLGRIFENLLAEINPETGESARKSTGSYYTPRVIVDYMVDESLSLYLREKTNILERKIKSLISYDLEDDAENPLNDEEKDKIAQALGSIKILDPACGSGAFPIGALQKIVFILQQIDPYGQLWFKKQIKNTPIELRKVIEREFEEKNFDYIRKLGIIRENIYGIDIQPIATEISRLRCFLTLVVDERIDDTIDNRGIEPLPNLDFKFVTANTLVSLPNGSGSASQMGLFEDDLGIKELKEVRDMFFNASGFERDQLKLQFVQTQNRMFQKLISEGRRGHADMTAKLTTWDPFSHTPADWFDPEWMFGIKEGFDLVIANPPYVSFYSRESHLDSYKQLITYLKDNYDITKKYKDRRLNLVMFFVEKSIKLLNKKGQMYFIVDANFIDKPFRSLRKLLVSFSCHITISKKISVFENVTSDQVLLSINRANYDKSISVLKKKNNDSFEQENTLTPQEFMEDYVLLDGVSNDINGLKLLGDIAYVSTGVQIGIGGTRVFNNQPIEDLFYSNIKIKDWFENISLKSDDFYQYCQPIIKNYINLDKNLAYQINKNVDKCNIAVAKVEPFINRKKIFVRQSSPKITATVGSKDQISEYSAFMLYPIDDMSIYSLVGILNSKFVCEYAVSNKIILTGNKKQPQIRLSQLKKIPIPSLNSDDDQKLSILVKQCIEEQNEEKKNKLIGLIDDFVNKLYENS